MTAYNSFLKLCKQFPHRQLTCGEECLHDAKHICVQTQTQLCVSLHLVCKNMIHHINCDDIFISVTHIPSK